MSLLDRVMHSLVLDLIERNELELEPGTDLDALAARLVVRVRAAANHAHIGHEICEALVADADVVEVYATDSGVIERLNFFYA